MGIIRRVRSLITSFDLGVVVSTTESTTRWLRLFTITRVIGVVSLQGPLNWNISGSGFVLSSVEDLFLISVGGLVGDDGYVTGLSGGDCPVLSLIDSVVAGLLLSPVLRLVLNSDSLNIVVLDTVPDPLFPLFCGRPNYG